MHIFIHLLNDFSGSPRIMGAKIASYRAHGVECFTITSGVGGFIRLENGPHKIVSYTKRPSFKLAWALNLLLWHIRTFFVVLHKVRRGDVVHASTLLTAPHLLAARLKGARTVIHIMETEVRPRLHRAVLVYLARRFTQRVVYLSSYVREVLGEHFGDTPWRITYPCIDPAILAEAKAQPFNLNRRKMFTVGLICSMIWHKGYVEFVELARRCPDDRFLLILNGEEATFDAQFQPDARPLNFEVRFNVKSIATALAEMDLLVSLTKREGWIETFGLTLIEAMSFGLPVIAPDIGAPIEFVSHGENGYLVDESNLEHVAKLIRTLHECPETYDRLAAAARATARRFTHDSFSASVSAELDFVRA